MKKVVLFIRKYFYKLKVIKTVCSFTEPIQVNRLSFCNNNTFLGRNINFNGMKIKGHAKVTIGDNFHSGQDCSMITDIHNYDGGNAIPYDDTYISKDIIIEDNVWLGDKVILLGGVTLGEGCIIQAGSVVSKSIPKYAIAGGHPAKVFKYRDIEHYNALKKKGKFH